LHEKQEFRKNGTYLEHVQLPNYMFKAVEDISNERKKLVEVISKSVVDTLAKISDSYWE